MHFDLTDLRLFAAVVEEGRITAGASRAGISLPSASARVKGMEEALGAALLERHRRGVRPTPAGVALCDELIHPAASPDSPVASGEREGTAKRRR